MKLKMYQDGGGLIYTPFIPDRGTELGTGKKSGTTDDTEDAKLDPLDKELLGLMKDQSLLPSDIQMIYNQLIRFQKKTQKLSAMPGFGGTGSYRSVMPGMLQIMNLVSQAKYNKAADDEIIKKMLSENAGNEFALDAYGRMYVQDAETGKIKKVSTKDFDSEKHSPLSNSQLLYLRERDSDLAFDGSIFDDMRNMVGMTSVAKEIDRIIKEFGTEEGQRYLSKESAQVFSELNNPDGMYKLTMKIPAEGLKQAWKTIWDQLPTNMQNLLKVRAAASGDIDPKVFIQDIVMHNTSKEQKIDYDATASKAAGFDTDPNKTEKEKAEALTQNNYLQRVGTLRGDRTVISIAPRGSKISDTAALSAHAFTFGTVIDRNNKPIEKMSLSDMLKDGWAFAAGEPNDITFGNRLLKDWERDAIMFDDSSNLTAVMLPYRNQGGHIVPDFELLDAFNKIQEVIQNNPNISKTELSSILLKAGISPSDINYDVNTNTISLKNTMAFLTVSAYAGDDTIDLSKDDKRYLERVQKTDGQHIKDFYNNMVKYGKLRPAKKGNVQIKGYSKSEANDFWRGNVFIPMKNAFNAMNLSGVGEYVPKSQETDFYERVAAKEQENAIQQYMRDNDPNYTRNTQLGQFRYE